MNTPQDACATCGSHEVYEQADALSEVRISRGAFQAALPLTVIVCLDCGTTAFVLAPPHRQALRETIAAQQRSPQRGRVTTHRWRRRDRNDDEG